MLAVVNLFLALNVPFKGLHDNELMLPACVETETQYNFLLHLHLHGILQTLNLVALKT